MDRSGYHNIRRLFIVQCIKIVYNKKHNEKKVIIIENLNIEQIIKNSTVEELFQVNIKSQDWIWVNKDIFSDIVYNALEYEYTDEDYLIEEINNISEDKLNEILNDKFKKIGWISVNQRLFEKLVEDFISTKDIETFIYVNKRFYTKKIIEKTNELSWILKAMAIDGYQHLSLEDKTLLEIYEEYFNENGMLIEEILLRGEYKFLNVATWKLDEQINVLEFYKMDERYRQWSEGNSNFMFYELSK